MKKKILFLCTANSCRSQMAEGLVNAYLGDRFEAYSAGTEETFVHPLAIEVMRELGIDISGQRSKNLSTFDGWTFDFVITLCGSANETCPLYIGGVKKTHIGFDDPAKAQGDRDAVVAEFRRVRNEMKEKLTNYFVHIA